MERHTGASLKCHEGFQREKRTWEEERICGEDEGELGAVHYARWEKKGGP